MTLLPERRRESPNPYTYDVHMQQWPGVPTPASSFHPNLKGPSTEWAPTSCSSAPWPTAARCSTREPSATFVRLLGTMCPSAVPQWESKEFGQCLPSNGAKGRELGMI
jgi:hypothetical protein